MLFLSVQRCRAVFSVAGALAGVLWLTGCSSTPKITGKRELFVPATQELAVDSLVASKPFHLPSARDSHRSDQERGSAAHAACHDVFDAVNAKLLSKVALGGESARGDTLITNMVAAHGKVFGATASGCLFAVDTQSLQVIWKTLLPLLPGNIAQVGGVAVTPVGELLVTAASGDIFLVEAATGKIKKQRNLGCSLRSAPTPAGGSFFVQSVNNRLFALDAQLNTQWSLEEAPESVIFLGNGSPAFAYDLVFAAFTTGEYKAYDAHTGVEVWMGFMTPEFLDDTYGNILQVRASPVISDDLAFILGHGGRLVAIHALSGEQQWSVPFSGLETPAVVGDWLFAVDEHGYVFCFEKTTGRVRWSSALPDGGERKKRPLRWTPPLLANNSVVFVTEFGDLTVFEASTGKLQRVLPAKAYQPVAALIVDQKLFVLSGQGSLYVFGN